MLVVWLSYPGKDLAYNFAPVQCRLIRRNPNAAVPGGSGGNRVAP